MKGIARLLRPLLREHAPNNVLGLAVSVVRLDCGCQALYSEPVQVADLSIEALWQHKQLIQMRAQTWRLCLIESLLIVKS